MDKKIEYCQWKYYDAGTMGCNDFIYNTQCGQTLNEEYFQNFKYCPYCGKEIWQIQ